MRLKVAQRHQPVVSIHHGVHADAIGMRELADGRQFGTGAQCPIVHHLAESGHDLRDKRNG